MFLDLKLQKLDDEYKILIQDILKFVTILIVFNFFMFISNPKNNVFMGRNYIEFVVYIVLGLLTHGLVVSKIIKFD